MDSVADVSGMGDRPEYTGLSLTQAERFWRVLHANQPDGWAVFFAVPGAHRTWIGEKPKPDEIPDGDDPWSTPEISSWLTDQEYKEWNVYLTPCRFRVEFGGRGPAKVRRRNDLVVSLPGVYADIDVKPGVPKSIHTTEERDRVLGALPRATMVVDSGSGGVHAYWLFDSPVTGRIGIAEMKTLHKAWRLWINSTASLILGRPIEIDAAGEAARVLRVPGTARWPKADEVQAAHDAGTAVGPTLVYIRHDDGPRYALDTLRGLVPGEIWQTLSVAPVSFAAHGITQGAPTDRYIRAVLRKQCDRLASLREGEDGGRNTALNSVMYTLAGLVRSITQEAPESERDALAAQWGAEIGQAVYDAYQACGGVSDGNDTPEDARKTMKSGWSAGWQRPISAPAWVRDADALDLIEYIGLPGELSAQRRWYGLHDTGMLARMKDMWGDRFRYVDMEKGGKQWFAWNGVLWDRDRVSLIYAAIGVLVEHMTLELAHVERWCMEAKKSVEDRVEAQNRAAGVGVGAAGAGADNAETALTTENVAVSGTGIGDSDNDVWWAEEIEVRRPDGMGKELRFARVVEFRKFLAKCKDNQKQSDTEVIFGRRGGVGVIEEAFNAEPRWLTFPNGVLDVSGPEGLARGLLEPRPEYMCTQVMGAEYVPNADWEHSEFYQTYLCRVLPDAEIREYVQMVMGSALTGVPREKAFWLLQGKSDCGKSVLLDILAHIFGTYSVQATERVLIAQGGSAVHQTDVQALRGKRLVVTPEPGPHDMLNSDTLKQFTGGEKMSSRAARSGIVETWKPMGVIVNGSNYPLQFDTQDTGIKNRMKIVHFDQVIPKAEQDKNLNSRITTQEGSAVIAWLVDGLRMYWERGLVEADKIISSNLDSYLDVVDPVRLFYREAVERGYLETAEPTALLETCLGAGTLQTMFDEWFKVTYTRLEDRDKHPGRNKLPERFAEVTGLIRVTSRHKSYWSGLRVAVREDDLSQRAMGYRDWS